MTGTTELRSIRHQMLISIFPLVVFLQTVFGLFMIYEHRARETQKLEDNTSKIARIFFNNISLPLYNFDHEQILLETNTVLAYRDIWGVVVHDRLEKKSIVSKFKKDWEGDFAGFASHTVSIYRVFRENIAYGGEEVGDVELYVTDSFINGEIARETFRLFGVNFLFAVFVIGALWFSINRLILVPISHVTEMIRRVGKGELGVSSDTARNDEFSIIECNIYSMNQVIQTREKELIAFNKRIQSLQTRLADIINSMPSTIIATDESGVVTQCNMAIEREMRIFPTDAVGKKIWELLPPFAKFKDDFDICINRSLTRERFRQKLIPSENKYFDIFLFPLRGEGDAGAVFRIDDVTEMENRDQQLRQIQKMEILGTLAGGIAHDLNNILCGIVGAQTLLELHVDSSSIAEKEFFQEHLRTISESSKRATDIVKQLLSLARKNEPVFAPVDLRNIVSHVKKVCQSSFDKAIELDFETLETPIWVYADATQMEQVLLNLCINGYHAMTIMRPMDEPQSGKLLVRFERMLADKQFIDRHPTAQERLYWKIIVSDTGVGMDLQTRSQLFTPFFSTKPKGQGTGLGLSMVYSIVYQHKGCIDVHSEKGQGATFCVFLPILEAPDSLKEDRREIKKGSGLILVVDDDPFLQKTAKSILEACGYSVLVAADGEEGVGIYRARYKEIRAVLLDMIMPKKSGKDVFGEMRAINPEIKVLLASGFSQDERVNAILNLGVKDFVQKPYTLLELSEALNKLVQS